MAALKTDLEKTRERESNLSRERAELATKLAESEKAEANMKCEYDRFVRKYEQLAARKESEQARLINQEPGLSIEQLRSVEAKLDQEKLGREVNLNLSTPVPF